MSIISAIRAFIATYPGLEAGALLEVDHLAAIIPGYAIVPTPGNKVVEAYVNGGSLREYPFLLRSQYSTADDLARIEACDFYESFSDWLDSQTKAKTLPVLGSGKTAISIEAVGEAYLAEYGMSDTGIYQVQCRLTYEQQP